jgi:hypothetical protein
VRDEQKRQTELVAKTPNERQDLGLNGHIECRGRLIGNDERRFSCDRHRDHRSLLLASR